MPGTRLSALVGGGRIRAYTPEKEVPRGFNQRVGTVATAFLSGSQPRHREAAAGKARLSGASFSHDVPANRGPALHKVIFTEPIFDADGLLPDGDVLAHAVNKLPLVEVHVDIRADAVTATFPPPEDPFYDNRQVPVI